MNVTLSHDRTSVDAAEGIFTHLSKVDKRVLDSLVRALIPASPVILEIGSYLGASACVMANALNGRGEVHCRIKRKLGRIRPTLRSSSKGVAWPRFPISKALQTF